MDIRTDDGRINWNLLNILRLGLGLAGMLFGLLLGAFFLYFWHWTIIVICFMFSFHPGNVLYLLDIVFVVALIAEGYVYKARMPPPSPWRNATAFAFKRVTGVAPFTPQQAAFSLSEILYVAPRIFFWGLRHLRCIALPGTETTDAADNLLTLLRDHATWVRFPELVSAAGSLESASSAMAALVKAELATGRSNEDGLAFRAWQPEWV